MRFIIFMLLSESIASAASFGGEIQRWGDTNTSLTSTIVLAGGISAGNRAVVLFGWESSAATLSLSGVSDSRGNSWSITNSLINSVHQEAIAHANVGTALQVNDTITVTWTGTGASVARAGVVVYLSGVSNASPDIVIVTNSSTSTITANGTTTVTNDFLIGIFQIDQVLSTYSPGTWTQIGSADLFGHTGSTDGLANYYLYFSAGNPGLYTLDGTQTSARSWQVIWMAFLNAPPPAGPTLSVNGTLSVGTIKTP